MTLYSLIHVFYGETLQNDPPLAFTIATSEAVNLNDNALFGQHSIV